MFKIITLAIFAVAASAIDLEEDKNFRSCNTTGIADEVDICRFGAAEGAFEDRLEYRECLLEAKEDMVWAECSGEKRHECRVHARSRFRSAKHDWDCLT